METRVGPESGFGRIVRIRGDSTRGHDTPARCAGNSEPGRLLLPWAAVWWGGQVRRADPETTPGMAVPIGRWRGRGALNREQDRVLHPGLRRMSRRTHRIRRPREARK